MKLRSQRVLETSTKPQLTAGESETEAPFIIKFKKCDGEWSIQDQTNGTTVEELAPSKEIIFKLEKCEDGWVVQGEFNEKSVMEEAAANTPPNEIIVKEEREAESPPKDMVVKEEREAETPPKEIIVKIKKVVGDGWIAQGEPEDESVEDLATSFSGFGIDEERDDESTVRPRTQDETNEHGRDYVVDSHVEIFDSKGIPMDVQKFDALCKTSYKSCRVDSVVFCDASRIPKTHFHPTEDVYAWVTFRNTSKTDYAFVTCAPGSLHQDGIYLEIRDEPMQPMAEKKDTASTPSFTPIPPGKPYTFFRKFTTGAAKPKEATQDCLVPTPRTVGDYEVVVKYGSRDKLRPVFVYSGAFQLSIGKKTRR